MLQHYTHYGKSRSLALWTWKASDELLLRLGVRKTNSGFTTVSAMAPVSLLSQTLISWASYAHGETYSIPAKTAWILTQVRDSMRQASEGHTIM